MGPRNLHCDLGGSRAKAKCTGPRSFHNVARPTFPSHPCLATPSSTAPLEPCPAGAQWVLLNKRMARTGCLPFHSPCSRGAGEQRSGGLCRTLNALTVGAP